MYSISLKVWPCIFTLHGAFTELFVFILIWIQHAVIFGNIKYVIADHSWLILANDTQRFVITNSGTVYSSIPVSVYFLFRVCYITGQRSQFTVRVHSHERRNEPKAVRDFISVENLASVFSQLFTRVHMNWGEMKLKTVSISALYFHILSWHFFIVFHQKNCVSIILFFTFLIKYRISATKY